MDNDRGRSRGAFHNRVMQELAGRMDSARPCQKAGLAAMLLCEASFHTEADGTLAMTLSPDLPGERPGAWTKLFTLLKKTFNITFESVACQGEVVPDFGLLLTRDQIYECARLCGMLPSGQWADLSEFLPHILRDDACRRSFLRNCFLCVGRVSDPEREYSASFDCSKTALAQQILKLCTSGGILVKILYRKRDAVVYSREADAISDLLNYLGAPLSQMELENSRIMRQMRGSINRKVNCETSNIRRSIVASGRQAEAIRALQSSSMWGSLPASLRQTGEARLEHPDLSMTELGALLNPPAGKSCVNHRLRKLFSLAGELQADV